MAQSKKLNKKLREQLNHFHNVYGSAYVQVGGLDGNCGIEVISSLGTDPPVNQLSKLIHVFGAHNDYAPRLAQVILSDVVGSGDWTAVKSVSYKGPVTVNPNSGNKIQVYIFTLGCIPKLIKKLPVKIRKEYFS